MRSASEFARGGNGRTGSGTALRNNLGAAVVLLGAVCGTLTHPSTASAEDGARGEILYQLCATCHGDDGAGNELYGAPAIAGMSEWYVAAQLHKFKSGARGAHPDDTQGLRMRPMSRTLLNDADVAAVAGFVAALPKASPPQTLAGGDATRGKTLYAPCSACHGVDASGNQALNGPPLTHTSDWYLLAQIKKFKSGVRGSNAKDKTGALMRPMANTLADDQAMIDVIAYIMTLSAD
jgi:cytochrome c oxidase subunit 2